MSEPIVVITNVSVDQDEICIPKCSEGPNCDQHSHIKGKRTLLVDVVVHQSSQEEYSAFVELLGKRCRLVPVEEQP